jgi:hypothetical protein
VSKEATYCSVQSILIAPADEAIAHVYPPCTEQKPEALDQWPVY